MWVLPNIVNSQKCFPHFLHVYSSFPSRKRLYNKVRKFRVKANTSFDLYNCTKGLYQVSVRLTLLQYHQYHASTSTLNFLDFARLSQSEHLFSISFCISPFTLVEMDFTTGKTQLWNWVYFCFSDKKKKECVRAPEFSSRYRQGTFIMKQEL